jgi:hypothetical protein
MTTPLQQAQQEWEAHTTPRPKNHTYGKRNPEIIVHEFRQFDKAIALMNWDGNRIEITKLETLQPGQGGATRLIFYLKALAHKYHVPLWGHARVYEPDPPIPVGPLLDYEKLIKFYLKHGFQLREIDANTSEFSYFPNEIN